MQEAIHRNGRSVAGFGLGTPSAAEAALHSIRVRLDQPPWLRGVGVTTATDGSDAVLIQVQHPSHVPMAQMIVGDRVNGVPVLYEGGQTDTGLGLGHLDAPMAPSHPSPWKYAVVMSLVSAATGWVLEEVAQHTFRKRKRQK